MSAGEVSRLRLHLHDARQEFAREDIGRGNVDAYVSELAKLGACCCAVCSYSPALVDRQCLNKAEALS